MKTIKFSHQYKKLAVLRSDMTARLLLVLEVNLEDLKKEFLEYDTEGIYKLPKKGKYLLLIFQGHTGLFTTLRRNYPSLKRLYYEKAIGETFKVEIK